MVNFPGRNGRRRRVLNDEVLSATNNRIAARTTADEDTAYQAPRYSEAAGVQHHPQITDFVPRRYRTIALLVATGIGVTVTLAGLHFAAPSIATVTGPSGVAALDIAATGSIATWMTAVILLLAAAMSRIVYSIRRHRIDDYRGRYRVWLAATVACLVLSVNSVAGLHHTLANSLSYITGWTALREGAVWWLALAGLPLAWITVRALFDVRECRLAMSLFIASIGCYATAIASYLGLVRVVESRIDTVILSAASLGGHWLLLAGVVTYARYVVLDAQGLIPVRRSRPESKSQRGTSRQSTKTANATLLSAGGYTRHDANESATSPSTSNAWVDGTLPERDPYDEDDESADSQKLSKADRKRLRKLKTQTRAA